MGGRAKKVRVLWQPKQFLRRLLQMTSTRTRGLLQRTWTRRAMSD